MQFVCEGEGKVALKGVYEGVCEGEGVCVWEGVCAPYSSTYESRDLLENWYTNYSKYYNCFDLDDSLSCKVDKKLWSFCTVLTEFDELKWADEHNTCCKRSWWLRKSWPSTAQALNGHCLRIQVLSIGEHNSHIII